MWEHKNVLKKELSQNGLEFISRSYRVSHIKLDRINGSKLQFGGQIRKFKKNESFKKT